MKIIPVLDVLNGVVVHAVKGFRSRYKPIQSVLTNSSKPLDVARDFKACGFSTLYVAYLDAIMGQNSDFSFLKQIGSETGLELMVDAGFNDLAKVREALENNIAKIVIGTETLGNIDFVGEAVRHFKTERVILSLDLKGNSVLGSAALSSQDPMVLLKKFALMGVTQVIVLDLTRVGSETGVNSSFLNTVLKIPNLKVFTGGGVRDIKDLIDLRKRGVFGVLVATALHNGKISEEQLRQSNLMS